MVWLESPTNPTMKLIDIKAVFQIAKRKNPKILTVCDNTFASSYFQVRVLDHLKRFYSEKKYLVKFGCI
jgi:cystathionine beta-lyase/cystathionine gamma-synthase